MGDDLVDHLVPILTHTSTGWWFQPTPLKKDDFVSWDDYSQYMEKNMFQTTNQMMIWGYHHFRKLDDSWFSEAISFATLPMRLDEEHWL